MISRSKRIIRPKWEFEDELEGDVWEFALEDCTIPGLKEEMKEERKEGVHYEYGCPYCSFRSPYFYCVDLHIAYSEKCYRSEKRTPCYPINHCYIMKNGKKYQYIP